MKTTSIIIIIIIIIVAWFVLRFVIGGSEDTWICVEGEWVKHGFPNASKPDKPCAGEDIYASNPKPNQVITSPLTITGKARGTWFFEGDFPVELIDEQDNLIAISIAQSQGGWMTEDFVDFKSVIEFEKPSYREKGTLILRKDNPSGLLEHDDTLEIPILFK